ncbi:hypothetical protein NLG97_g795 [Lecanicillium saksenae]|uniref:Uncharacterized protein n=1 Tax=Lecanicillium saksenae TaxID=468837 RepID=A0ACC1R7H8_9HYPO|nr:hypothetical protein NLG97_g795 [Lecanicillium saksenae]
MTTHETPCDHHHGPHVGDGEDVSSVPCAQNGTSDSPNGGFDRSYQIPVAICGVGMRLPAGIKNDRDLFSFLSNKGDARTVVPSSRYNAAAYHTEHNKPGSVASTYGYFLQDIDFGNFDTSMFTMTATEVNRLDPSQRLLLEVVREAFENAGEANFRGKNIGTFASVYSEDWQYMQNIDFQYGKSPYSLTGVLDFMLANRVAYEYDLRGPSVTLKAACASSAMAMHQALQAIRGGEISSALVMGTNLILAPYLGVTMSVAGLLSPDGSCKSFDAAADGYGRGEAVCCIYVKRLDDALRDGNAIRSVIRASSSNSSGRTSGGLTNPNPAAHESLIRRTYEAAGLPCGATAMVECHGTGTIVGDPLEAAAMASCFGESGVYIGSVKPNLGHSEGVAALTSLIKAVISLERRVIIPNINFVTPNDAIPWASKKLCVPTELKQWPEDRCERISVHSYGVGGSNAHFIIDSAPSALAALAADANAQTETSPDATPAASKNLLLFSANNSEGLKAVGKQHLDYLKHSPDRIKSLEYTLAHHRERLQLPGFCVTDSSGAPNVLIHSAAQDGQPPNGKVAFIFTGQGAQWAGMGQQLIADHPQFRETIEELDEVLQSIEHAPSWRIKDVLLDSGERDVLFKPEVAQPVCAALQIALVDLLGTWGVHPQAVLGHSSGEIAAAYCAKVLTSRAAILIAFYRGRACSLVPLSGGMAVVGIAPAAAKQFLRPGVCIACENSPENITLSGEAAALAETIASIKHSKPRTFTRILQIPVAYHSEHMNTVGRQYADWIRCHADLREPQIPFVSSTYGLVLTKASDFGSNYWKENLECRVKFSSAVLELLQQFPDASTHLEIGPHGALRGSLRDLYAANGVSRLYLSSLSRDTHDSEAFLTAIGYLYCSGYSITVPVAKGAQVLTDLPTFPWQYGSQKFWTEPRASRNLRFPLRGSHDLLGRRTVDSPDLEPTWRNMLRLVDVPWLQDHIVSNQAIFSATGYIAMAGEAISQLLHEKHEGPVRNGYAIRDLHFTNIMTLHDDKATEIITSLRPVWSGSNASGSWYEFTIMSYNGSSWTRHCRGLVASSETITSPAQKLVPDVPTRRVNASRFYSTLARAGITYGSRFRALQDVTACVRERAASCEVTDMQEEWESPYPIHPATMDMVLQTFIIAKTRGIYRNFKRLFLPTSIKELRVCGAAHGATMRVHTCIAGETSSLQAIADGKVVFSVSGLATTQLENGSREVGSRGFQVQQMRWVPDIDLLDLPTLMPSKLITDHEAAFRQTERLFVLFTAHIRDQFRGIVLAEPHFSFYLDWLEKQVERFKSPNYPLVPDSANLVAATDAERRELIKNIVDGYENGSGHASIPPFLQATWQTCQYLPEILSGKINFLELMMQDGLLQSIYDWMNELQDVEPLFRLLGYSKPNQRILELGAGTGGLTSKVLSALQTDHEKRLYSIYTFTDVSAGFFIQAQKRFRDSTAVEYRVLDISQDPIEQGFQEGSYDLIIASNVLHATPCLTQTLVNCRRLLRPDGRLVMQELSSRLKFPNFIMGLFAGWWLGREDGRVDEPYVDLAVWDAKLREAGFQGVDAMATDSDDPNCHVNSIILARPAPKVAPVKDGLVRCITILVGENTPGLLAQATQEHLELSGYIAEVCIWKVNSPKRGQDVVSLVDVEGLTSPVLCDLRPADLQYMLELVDNLNGATLLWLLRPAQIRCLNPNNGFILGFARTARLELGVRFATMELTELGDVDAVAAAVAGVMQKLQRAAITEDLSVDCQDGAPTRRADMEYAWKGSAVQISRFHGLSVSEALIAASDDGKMSTQRRLVVGKIGQLSSLQWHEHLLDNMGPDEVRVEPRAIGIVVEEVQNAMGTLRTKAEDGRCGDIDSLGAEGAGVVVARGSRVSHVEVGDRVMWLAREIQGFATMVQMPAAWCIKMPENLSFQDASTIPTAYATALSALVHKARLGKGQSVLVHCAADDVGIAAMHIARWIGAEIYATVRSQKQVDLLTCGFGMQSHRIFDFRDVTFAAGIIQATNGSGVDVVLGSLSGDLLHASWECLAPEGCLVQIIETDTMENGSIAVPPFLEERTMTSVNLSLLFLNHTKVQHRLQEIVGLYRDGYIPSILPVSSFDAINVQDAFKSVQKGEHCGKCVILFPDTGQCVPPLTKIVPAAFFKSEASYLLVGGTGGLGKSLASWMACHGAGNLIFVSPTAGQSAVDQELFAELRASDCRVQYYAADAADEKMLRNVVQRAIFPIVGVMQLAMVLQDTQFMDMNTSAWEAAMKPKVDGTWNVDRVLTADLDFFVLFSSVTSIFGNYGQANYASANSFLDAFAQYRHSLGKAASVINLCAIEDVGYVSRVSRRTGIMSDGISEQNFLDAVQLAIAVSRPAPASACGGSQDLGFRGGYEATCQILLVPEKGLAKTAILSKDPRMAMYYNKGDYLASNRDTTTTSETVRAFISSLPAEPHKLQSDETVRLISQSIAARISTLLMIPNIADHSSSAQTLTAFGVDSLVGIELKDWCNQVFRVEISVLELMSCSTIPHLANCILNLLRGKYPPN